MKIKLQKNDWESLISVASQISALKLTLSQVLNIEEVIDIVKEKLGNYFEEREKLMTKGEKFLDAYNQKLQQLFKQYGEGSRDPAILAFADDGKKQLEESVNSPLEKLGSTELEIDFPEDLFAIFKAIYAKQAFFGDKKGYNDNELGKAAFARAVKALGIKNEELGSSVPETVVEKK